MKGLGRDTSNARSSHNRAPQQVNIRHPPGLQGSIAPGHLRCGDQLGAQSGLFCGVAGMLE
jgi:hypothetical protein